MDKIKEFFLKLYRMRFRISRKGTPVLNWSVLFSLICLIFAPKLTVAGVIIALLLGYQFSFDQESAEFGTQEIEEKIRNAARTIRNGASNAASAVKAEAGKAAAKNETKQAAKNDTGNTAGKDSTPKAEPEKEAVRDTAPVRSAPVIRREPEYEDEEDMENVDLNEDVLADLARHADDFQSNPAATTFHSAYSAMADSVPTLRFPDDEKQDNNPGRRTGAYG